VRGQTILVTGGAGFIGGNFVRYCVESVGARVVNLDALTYAGNLDTLAPVMGIPDHIFVKGSIGDGSLVGRLLAEHRPSAIVNFAAETNVDRSIDNPRKFMQTNILETFELLEAVRTYWANLQGQVRERFRFLHVSTDEVYGSLSSCRAFSEYAPYRPNSPYAASKASSDHLVRAYHNTYGLPVITSNSSNNYGPYQFPEKLIPLIIQKALDGKTLPLYGDGRQIRDWLYVMDHCRAIILILEGGEPGEVYNVGGCNEKTNLEVVGTVCTLLDELLPNSASVPHASLVSFVEDRPGHDRHYAIDVEKIQRELGWFPEETFDRGLRKTVCWYLDNQAWCQRIFSKTYRGERLGLARESNVLPQTRPQHI
jgi:dTDP-glucose 4,6-dehydratase